jgi:hypothetical protein
MRPPTTTHRFGAAVTRCQTADEKFPRVTVHELWHTAASLMIASSANVKTVQAQLGHKTATMTLDQYGYLFPDDLDDVADKMDDLVSGCAQNVPTKGSRPGRKHTLTCSFTAYSVVELPGIELGAENSLTCDDAPNKDAKAPEAPRNEPLRPADMRDVLMASTRKPTLGLARHFRVPTISEVAKADADGRLFGAAKRIRTPRFTTVSAVTSGSDALDRVQPGSSPAGCQRRLNLHPFSTVES